MALASREISDARETPASIGQIQAASLSEYKASVLSQLRYIVDRMRADRGYRYLLAGLDASPRFLEIYRQNAPGNYRFVADGLLPHAPNLSRAEIKSITVLVLSTVVALGAKASQFRDDGEADAFVEEGLRMIWG